METIGITSVSFSNNKTLLNKLKNTFPKAKILIAKKKLTKTQLKYIIKQSDRIIVGLEKLDKKILPHAKKLKRISKYGVGLDNIDLNVCKNLNISVKFKKGVNKRSVSELVLSSAILLSRNMYKSNHLLKSGVWKVNGGENISQKKFGIIGFGNIGQDLAKLLKPFNCKIFYNDIKKMKKPNKNFTFKSKDYIYKNCDFISLHLPLTKKTYNLIRKKEISKMKKNTILINSSRGKIVNERDLFSSLRKKIIKGAVIDVFSKEPYLNVNNLNIDNLFALPHIGGSSKESIMNMGLFSIKNLK